MCFCMCDERPFCHCGSGRVPEYLSLSLSTSHLPRFYLSLFEIGPTCTYEGQSRINLVTPRLIIGSDRSRRCPPIFCEIGTPRVVEWIVLRWRIFLQRIWFDDRAAAFVTSKTGIRARHLSFRFIVHGEFIGVKRILLTERRKEMHILQYIIHL